MCTNFVVIKKNGLLALASTLGVNPEELLYLEHAKPGSRVSIVTDSPDGHQLRPATWWLFLKQTDSGLKPHPDYFSVNTNYAKLAKRPEYKTSRCIVPATAFMESQNGKHPHLLEPADGSALAFGGLYKEWVDKVTGEVTTSCSIITLPGIAQLEHIHRKSTPLWLAEADYEHWLDRELTNTEALEGLLEPRLVTDLKATPIDKMSSRIPIGETAVITA